MGKVAVWCLLGVFNLVLGGSQSSQSWTNVKSVRPGIHLDRGRIIGGEEVEPHSYPYQVGLRINGNAFCGGSLISENYVMTAAHCGTVINTVQVVLGAHNITDATEPTQVVIAGAKVINHEQYDGVYYVNDISLIQLETPAPLSDAIQVAQLPPSSDAGTDYDGQTATAIGWGLTFDVPFPSTRDLSPVLKKVDVAVIKTADCGDYYNDPALPTDYINPTNVCTDGYKNKGTCEGDSGSPLILDGVVIGLTSFGTDFCEMCSPSVYTKVNDYVDWIRANSDVSTLSN